MPTVEPSDVHATLRRHSIASGHSLVLDLAKSHGLYLSDALSGREYLDFASFYASNALGFHHPRLEGPEARERLMQAALVKVGNPEFYTAELAAFVSAVERVAAPTTHPHFFFVEGGALAVENAMKTAMDWKVRKNLARGFGEVGTEILHFENAFHGRAGYTLSVTNTDPAKTLHFPKFDWPRIPSPALRFPLTSEHLERTLEAEAAALEAIDQAFQQRRDRIAAILIEPIQGEGGDRHFRAEFLQSLRRLADEREALLIFDEVQTGVGVTGTFWAHEYAAVRPDIICFAKKLQVGGFMASTRIDDVDNVFRVPSRISSTWGGGLVDMVRATYILEAIEEEKLVANADERGRELVAGLHELAHEFPERISNVRGRGLFCAFDLPTSQARNELVKRCFAEQLLVLAGGPLSVRLRAPLVVSRDEVSLGIGRLRAALRR